MKNLIVDFIKSFGDFLSGGSRATIPCVPPPIDVLKEVQPLDNNFNGVVLQEPAIPCSFCVAVDGEPLPDCPVCNGRGYVSRSFSVE